ncbi:transglutaminase family protein [Ramlibacter sp. USB13]|uniref:Transglutaminase family protein n=1 Tax=Ramlibacter cellulosilyticus TaxID=2764187 RepID=A0A923MPD0_9BURK|nr:transglutaminase family protein [Ramlibacter cellulosilyticus]MBC5782436.1 transglutaminase family protein [Ramlibacter cellulosilyticus]
MLLHVVHETAYDYAPMVRTAQHMAHLKPLALPTQEVLGHRLAVDPAPVQRTESLDVFGNTRTFFSLEYAHDSLRVVADSLVSTSAAEEPASSLPWEEGVERLRYHRNTRYDPAAEFAFASPYTPRDAAFVAYAQPSFAKGRPLLEAARDLMARIHADFEYETTATDVNTPALEALALRKGVCQDLAHVMLGCLRSLGLSARYVSGYLLTEPPPGRPRLVGCDASHAWVSVYLPGAESGGQWVDLDPTNDRSPGEDYVTLAIGRDYADVSPMRGVIHGGAHHTLRVAVTVTPAENGGMIAAPRSEP